MSDFRFHSVELLHLLWLVPMVIGLLLYAASKRQQALARLFQNGMLTRVQPALQRSSRFRQAFLVVAALVFLVVGLARPAWNKKETTVKRAGRDVVFLLDVSRSMLAEDLAPNRLERAKLAILDCIDKLQGDRVGLLAFAGTTVVKCPLTLDYGFFRMATEGIAIDSVSVGGTLIGDALRQALGQVFDKRDIKYKDIVLITDGEDHESFPVEAAKLAGKQGVRLIIVGLGDEQEGQRIPIVDAAGRRTFLKHEGREVWTRLDRDTLRKMAATTPGGRYLPVATGTIDLGEVYRDLIATAEKKELEDQKINRYEEKYQIFLGIAFALLCVEVLISRGKTGKSHEQVT